MGIGTPFTLASTATRHLLDANVTFGQSSERYNARDQYRRSYTDGQRVAAGVGTGLAVAVPLSAGALWAQRGMKIPGLSAHSDAVVTGLSKAKLGGLSPAAIQNIGRAAGVVALGGATYVGVRKTMEMTDDDGHFGAVGGASGILLGTAAGVAVGMKLGGKVGAMTGLAGAVAGGTAGYMGGSRVKVGEREVGTEHVQAPQVDASVGDRVGSFAGGAFNHFNETGPATQGISMGYRWGLRDAVTTKYSNAERAGAMHGDLLAAGIMGGGALAVGGGLLGMSRYAGAGVSNVRAGAHIAGEVLARGPVTAAVQKLGSAGTMGVGMAALGISGVLAAKEWDRAMDASGGDRGRAAAYAGGMLAASAGTAALVSRSGALQGLAAAPRAAASALGGVMLVAALSTARMPLQQFMDDARASTAVNGGIDWSKAGPVGAVAGGGAAYGALRGLSALVPAGGVQIGRFHLPKAAVVAAGTAVSAAAGGGVGVGLSSTMPDLKTIGMAAAGGAAVGAGVGRFARGMGAPAGAIAGAALGISSSALWRHDEPAAPAPVLPQDAAGSVAG